MNEKKIKIYGIAGTPWNAMGIDAYFWSLNENRENVEGTIYIRSHKATGISVSDKNFKVNINGIRYEILKKNKESVVTSIFRRVKTLWIYLRINPIEENEKITVLCPGAPDYEWIMRLNSYKKKENVEFIIVDDGFYNPAKEGNRLEKLYRKCIYEHLLKKYKVVDRRILLEEDWVTQLGIKKAYEYEKADKDNIINDYINIFGFYKDLLPKDVLNKYEGAVIVSTQSFDDSDEISEKALQLYESLYEILIETGNKVILKPHPREHNIDKYKYIGYEVDSEIKGMITQEVIIANLKEKPKCVISISSATLGNAKLFYDIPAISLAKIIVKEIISTSLKDEMSEYINAFENQWIMPEDLSDFKNMLGRL